MQEELLHIFPLHLRETLQKVTMKENTLEEIDVYKRQVQVSGLNNFTSSLEELEEQYVTYNDYHELCSYKLGFHAEYTTDKKLLEGLAGLSEKYHAPVYTHNSETKRDVYKRQDQCSARK